MEKLPVYGISEFVENKDEVSIYANKLCLHLASHQFVNYPHKHNTYIIVFFTQGSGEHHVDFETYTVKPGSIFLLSPGQMHCWKLSADADGWVVFHSKEFYNSIFTNRQIENFPFFYLQQNYPVIYLTEVETEKLQTIFIEISTEFSLNIPFRNAGIGSLLDWLYISLSRLYQIKNAVKIDSNSNFVKVKRLQKLIDENYKTMKLPNEYADLMAMSTRHLSRICNEVLNKTTSELIADRIIMEAKRWLVNNEKAIAEIADELGYEDYSYFIRIFKKAVGMSPKEFQVKMKTAYWS